MSMAFMTSTSSGTNAAYLASSITPVFLTSPLPFQARNPSLQTRPSIYETLTTSDMTQRDILTNLQGIDSAISSVASDITGSTGYTLSDLHDKLLSVA